jgi:predicted  nucleic acid-binding Zn-ribbon protein
MARGSFVKVDAPALERATAAKATSASGTESRGPLAAMVLLSDLDSLIHEAQDDRARARLRKLGFALDGLPRLLTARQRLAETADRRWVQVYERVRQRYGRGLAAVRERVCSGCFVTLPTTARPRLGSQALQICESCGRLLYWT